MRYLELARKSLNDLQQDVGPAGLTDAAVAWASDDGSRWDRVLGVLRAGWDLSQDIDSPRDLLVRWASAHLRLARASEELRRLRSGRRPIASRTWASIEAREADLSFFGRMVRALDPRAARAAAVDHEVRSKLETLIRSTKGSQ